MIRNHRGGIDAEQRFVNITAEVNAGGTDNLGDDDAFRTVDDKGAALGHDREIAHEDFLFLDLLRLLVAQTDPHLQRAGIGGVAGLALFLRVLRRVIHGVVDEAQLQVAGIVRDGIHIPENLFQPGIQKPSIRALLNLEQIRHVHDFLCAGKAFAERFPVKNIRRHWHSLLIHERRGELSLFAHPALILLADHAILFSRWTGVPLLHAQ